MNELKKQANNEWKIDKAFSYLFQFVAEMIAIFTPIARQSTVSMEAYIIGKKFEFIFL